MGGSVISMIRGCGVGRMKDGEENVVCDMVMLKRIIGL
jgi:hypothetical protein